MSVYHHDGFSAGGLVNLLRRNKKLVRLDVKDQDTLPAVCRAIVEGCCRGVERLGLFEEHTGVFEEHTELTQERLDLLAGALQVDGALAALRTLEIDPAFQSRALSQSQLTTVLGSGAAPSLQLFYFDETGLDEGDWSSIADMVEARTRIPGCKGLKLIYVKFSNWLDGVPLATQIRLFRASLPTVKELPHFYWSRRVRVLL